ncbi:MAG: hypothetical protein DCC71_04655 [Proteobacteria bacterium]|nr:MAG: hypothetical protein DCC71_04655 [Pseudomonadota bacterium]
MVAACAGSSGERDAAKTTSESTEVTVDSATRQGDPVGQPADAKTQVNVRSADDGKTTGDE